MWFVWQASGTSTTTPVEGGSSAALSPTSSRVPLNKEDAFVDEASGNQDSSQYLFQDNVVLEVPGEGQVALSPDAIKKLTSREVQDMYQVTTCFTTIRCIEFFASNRLVY